MSTKFVDRKDTIVIEARKYRITGSGAGTLTLEPVLPDDDGYYMTANNIKTMGGVLIQRQDGEWAVLNGGYHRRDAKDQLAQIVRWNETLGLARVHLVAIAPEGAL